MSYHGQKWKYRIAALKYMLEVFQSRTGALAAWNSTWGESFDNLSRGIALNSAAQEAAQSPALRLWNASIGLNQSATGVLVALSGQGRRTTEQSRSGGSGEFWSGLFSSATSAFMGGIGSGLINGVFK